MSATGFTHPEFLVETEWLAAHLGDPNLVVLDCTTHLIPDPKITYTVKSGPRGFREGPYSRRAVRRSAGRPVGQ